MSGPRRKGGRPAMVKSPPVIPAHVAIIMDGNGRWATERGQARLEGHRRGADVVREITTYSRELGVRYLTLYSFSVQNWTRPPAEVGGLMGLLEEYCASERQTLMKNSVRLELMGRLDRVPPSTRRAVEELMQATRENTGMRLTLAIDYGGREELVEAARRLAIRAKAGDLDPEAIDGPALAAELSAADLPDPDLVIRTSGEIRVSNFLLWQIAYAELVFTPVYWPDFTRADFAAALDEFGRRQRRFGGTEPASPGGSAPTELRPGRVGGAPRC